MELAIQILLNSIVGGAIYSLVALGFNLTYATARFFDLGYGALAAFGGYIVFYLYKVVGLNLELSILIAVLASGMLGLLIDVCIYRTLRRRKASSTVLLIASLGVLTVVQALLAITFSSQFQTLSRDVANATVFHILGGTITEGQTVILATGLCIMSVLAYAMRYTLWGKSVRAIADDEEVAKIVGVNTERSMSTVFFIGGMIGGVAGIATGFDTGLLPTMGLVLLLTGVIAAIIGGVGNVYGGVLGAFLLSIILNLAAWFLSDQWVFAIAFTVLTLFLLVRPQGILPK